MQYFRPVAHSQSATVYFYRCSTLRRVISVLKVKLRRRVLVIRATIVELICALARTGFSKALHLYISADRYFVPYLLEPSSRSSVIKLLRQWCALCWNFHLTDCHFTMYDNEHITRYVICAWFEIEDKRKTLRNSLKIILAESFIKK